MALTSPQNGDLTKSLKSARKKVPQSALLRAGGGVQSLFGQCPNRGGTIFKGASLTAILGPPGPLGGSGGPWGGLGGSSDPIITIIVR